MACRQHSTDKKTRKRIKPVPSLTRRSEWACCMNGADPEWLNTPDAQRYAKAFPNGMPQWLLQAELWRAMTKERFKTYRRERLGMNVAQCAAYLGVSQADVKRWEAGQAPIPACAFEALRLQAESMFARLSHKMWDGWFVHRKTGEFVSPDVGRLALTPAELNSLPMIYAERSILVDDNARQATRIAELEAENAALRSGVRVKTVAQELELMHDRIADLLGALRTADVIPFPVEQSDKPVRVTA